MASHDTDLTSAENEEVKDRDRSRTYLPVGLLQRCEVHEYIFSVITSGVICVLKLCYALHQTHVLMTCTCNCSMHISSHATAPCTFSTCNCSMHAHSAPARTCSGSPHNVLHSSNMYVCNAQECTQECNKDVTRTHCAYVKCAGAILTMHAVRIECHPYST